jgi:hypothetical protein
LGFAVHIASTSVASSERAMLAEKPSACNDRPWPSSAKKVGHDPKHALLLSAQNTVVAIVAPVPITSAAMDPVATWIR